jgi:hypothetical protein
MAQLMVKILQAFGVDIMDLRNYNLLLHNYEKSLPGKELVVNISIMENILVSEKENLPVDNAKRLRKRETKW